MKVMHICQMIGGIDTYVRNSIQAADGSMSYVIVGGKRDNNRPVLSNEKKVPEIKVDLKREIDIISDFRALYQILNAIKSEHPDVIHCHSAKAGLLGRLAGWLTGTKTYYTPHAFSFLSGETTRKRRLYKFLERLTRFDAKVIACGETEQRLARNYVKYPDYRALVWHNCVPEPVIEPEELTLHLPKRPYILFIGRPSYQKNPLLFLDVAQRVMKTLPDSYFIMLGVGFYSPALKQMQEEVKNRNLKDNIKVLNWANHDDALNYLRNSELYITVSRYEGLPFSVLEAMSLGKAVVATNVAGNCDCVKDGVTGFLAEDADSLAEGVIKLMQDKSLREKMGQAGHDYYEAEFNIQKRIGLLKDIYAR